MNYQHSNDLLRGDSVSVPEGSIVINSIMDDMHVRCQHDNGRTDEYHLKRGERLVVDERARLQILNLSVEEHALL